MKLITIIHDANLHLSTKLVCTLIYRKTVIFNISKYLLSSSLKDNFSMRVAAPVSIISDFFSSSTQQPQKSAIS